MRGSKGWGGSRVTWYPELGTRTMVAAGEHVRAVGWLAAGQPYTRGAASPEFVAALRQFVAGWRVSGNCLGLPLAAGPHACEFCGQFLAAGNFGVPSGEVLYVAPEMVLHYVQVHEYLPPSEFISAVLGSPVPGTPEYAAAAAPFAEIRRKQFEQRLSQGS
ncbi:MAG: hypothetical protein HYY18_04670 [Planctomycetes bacterium]|nr:hypothetical protein [Planctomycetota bacterium]